MKTINKLTLIFAILALAAVSAFGQTTTLSTTTLSAAITSTTTTTISITSTSGWLQAGPQNRIDTCFYVDRELFGVVSIPSSGTVVVQRRGGGCGALGEAARPTTHNSGATVYYVNTVTNGNFITPASTLIASNLPELSENWGSCTSANELSLPRIYMQTGDIANCINSQWVQVNNVSAHGVLATGVTIAAGTNAVSGTTMITDTGTAAMVTLTVPAGWGVGQCVQFVPGGAFTTTNAGNIRIASTAVVGKVLFECWDSVKWDPSY